MAFLKPSGADDAATIPLTDDAITYLLERSGKLLASKDRQGAEVALSRIRSNWVILDYTGYKTSVNGLRVADCKQVREGDLIQIGSVIAQLSQKIRREVVRDGSPLLNSKQVCYVDQVGFKVGSEVIFCPACGTPHHAECWQYTEQTCAQCGYQPLQSAKTGDGSK